MSVISSSFRARVRSSIEEPVARFFGRLGFSPNALTLIGFGIAVVGAYFAALESWLIAGIVVAFGAAFDLFDGALARATGKTSRFGAFLDSTFDRAGEAVVYLGIAAGLISAQVQRGEFILGNGTVVMTNLGATTAIFALVASFMVSYTRAKSESLGFNSGSGLANVGLAPREVRAVIVTLALVGAGLLAPVRPSPAVGPFGWWYVLFGALALIAVLATLTTIQRIYFVYRQSQLDTD
jgi:phosphatidylglycerophosphate synthase